MISFFISIIRTIIRYYGLKLTRSGKGFNLSAGLFTKRSMSALDHKIQTISWSDNLLKKRIKIFDLKFEQAGSEESTNKKSIKVPSCKREHIEAVLSDLFPKYDSNSISLNKIDIKWLYRRIIFTILFGACLAAIGFYVKSNIMILGLFLMVILPFQSFLRYRKARFGLNKEFFLIKGGTYGDKNLVFPIYKLQSVSQTQSPYMRRNHLVNLTFHHASGNSTVPYVDEVLAQKITDYVLFIIETSKKKWM